ncbi:hypothetical protein AHMF7605_07935 [Adhaeribacter arboris]|uniref:Uncharacterized protein n=1 Tax=Adhaeribacter arboris TaxID=2072846 RepID=A0A2T2YD62_9BACT|nr:hypothetical protein [Adhaeribacter arboris]PSR53460.1 hypothetical protein AHMF7605_07935 [Adhaeribacter arboris]
MKSLTLFLAIVTFYGSTCLAQQKEPALVQFKLKNASLLPKRITIISYQPGDPGNGTESVTVAPKSEKEVKFKEGTKIYLANSKQVDAVMSGKRIDSDKPFLIVQKNNGGKTIPF